MNLLPRSWTRRLGGAAGIALCAALAVAFTAPPAAAQEGTILGAGNPAAVPGSYLVILHDAAGAGAGAGLDDAAAAARRAVEAQASALTDRYGGTVGHVYDAALTGFSVTMGESAARRLAAHPSVAYVEQDMVHELADTQPNPPSWGLDRIDQRNRPLDQSYTFPNTAPDVEIHILDTGIRLTHNDFGGGRARTGFDAVTPGGSASDCHGHGTHVAGTAAGAAHGVAKGAELVAVRVLNCAGSGTTSQIVAGINWVTNNANRPAVANMSLGGPGTNTTMNNAVANSIASGITYAIAAGNSNANACNFSPSQVPAALTVGATSNTSNDARAGFSNFGTCLDIFAPGQGITSAWFSSDNATNTISGTSMASPHVAGAAALLLADNPTWSPGQVADRLIADATTGVVSNPGPGSPNRLLFVDNDGGGEPPPEAVFADDFETDQGWTTGGGTATTGLWERGVPQATSFQGTPLQLGNAPSGSNVLVTGRLAGTGPGSHDVDGGTTSVLSPQIDLPGGAELTLSFSWYLAHLNNSSNADFFRVVVVTGAGDTVLGTASGAATDRAAAWGNASLNLTPFAGQTVRIRFDAADEAAGSLVEAAVDDVAITES